MTRAASIPLPVELRNVVAGLACAKVADDQRWLLTLMREQGLMVITMLWRMLGSEQDVLDAYQSAVCRLAARGKTGLGSNPAGYFYRTVTHSGIEILRARQRQQNHWPKLVDAQRRREPTPTPCVGLDQREALAGLRRAICQLPPHLRNVVVLRDLGELPYAQVARTLGIRNGTARLYRRQAVLRLAEIIGQEANP